MKAINGIREKMFFGSVIKIRECNSWGMTKNQIDKVYNNSEPELTKNNEHTCWYQECKSKAASKMCRICGKRRF